MSDSRMHKLWENKARSWVWEELPFSGRPGCHL